MAVTITPYNNLSAIFAQGGFNSVGTVAQPETADELKVALFTDDPPPTPNPADVDMNSLTGGTYTENTQSDYTNAGGAVSLANITVLTNGNDCALDADDASWSVTADPSGLTARYAIAYRAAKTGDAVNRPLFFIDFGQPETAAQGTDFKVVWASVGIITFTVA